MEEQSTISTICRQSMQWLRRNAVVAAIICGGIVIAIATLALPVGETTSSAAVVKEKAPVQPDQTAAAVIPDNPPVAIATDEENALTSPKIVKRAAVTKAPTQPDQTFAVATPDNPPVAIATEEENALTASKTVKRATVKKAPTQPDQIAAAVILDNPPVVITTDEENALTAQKTVKRAAVKKAPTQPDQTFAVTTPYNPRAFVTAESNKNPTKEAEISVKIKPQPALPLNPTTPQNVTNTYNFAINADDEKKSAQESATNPNTLSLRSRLKQQADPPNATNDGQESVTNPNTLSLRSRLKQQADPPNTTNDGEDETEIEIVRLDPDGVLVIAGRGKSNSKIAINVNGIDIGTTTADAKGEWVLISTDPIAIESLTQTDQRAAAQPDLTSSTPTLRPEAGSGLRSKDGAIQHERVNPPASELAAVQPDLTSSTPTLRPEAGSGLRSKDGAISVDAISYNDNGDVEITGTASRPHALIEIHIDRNRRANVYSNDKGDWIAVLKDFPAGLYQLDALIKNTQGAVIAIVSFPIKRSVIRQDAGGGSVIVQPGNSLWRIAIRFYQSGANYPAIYDANRSKIDDPDLIYPGQIFNLPMLDTNPITETN